MGYLFSSAEDKPSICKKINSVISSPLGVAILGAMTFLAFAFSLEFEFYCFVIVYAMYVAMLADDLAPLMPLFILCYITPSAQNNPGKSENSLFWGGSGLFLLCFVSVAVVLFFVRVALDEKMGMREFFLKKRMMFPGLLSLGAAFLLSGIGSKHYTEYALRNIVFAALQFLAFFLLYFFFSATVDFKKLKPSFIGAIGITMGAVVTLELTYISHQGRHLGWSTQQDSYLYRLGRL